MAQVIEGVALSHLRERGAREKQLRILAKSLFRELRSNGYTPREMVALSTELLGLITSEIKPESK